MHFSKTFWVGKLAHAWTDRCFCTQVWPLTLRITEQCKQFFCFFLFFTLRTSRAQQKFSASALRRQIFDRRPKLRYQELTETGTKMKSLYHLGYFISERSTNPTATKVKILQLHLWYSINNPQTIGHFRVPKSLSFKMRPSAQHFLWTWVLFAREWKIIFIWKVEHRGTRKWHIAPALETEKYPTVYPRHHLILLIFSLLGLLHLAIYHHGDHQQDLRRT